MSHPAQPRPIPTTLQVVSVIVPTDGRYVLVQEAKAACRGKWSLPGGVVERGERLLDAARREALEETGLHVTPVGLIWIEHTHKPSPTPDAPHQQKLHFIVVAELVGGALKTVEDEHSIKAATFAPDSARGLTLRDPRHVRWIDVHAAGSTMLPLTQYDFRIG